jgi:hypothetical protein
MQNRIQQLKGNHELYNASKNIRNIALIKSWLVQPKSKPVEIATSGLHGIYPYRRMSDVESGSPEALAEG